MRPCLFWDLVRPCFLWDLSFVRPRATIWASSLSWDVLSFETSRFCETLPFETLSFHEVLLHETWLFVSPCVRPCHVRPLFVRLCFVWDLSFLLETWGETLPFETLSLSWGFASWDLAFCMTLCEALLWETLLCVRLLLFGDLGRDLANWDLSLSWELAFGETFPFCATSRKTLTLSWDLSFLWDLWWDIAFEALLRPGTFLFVRPFSFCETLPFETISASWDFAWLCSCEAFPFVIPHNLSFCKTFPFCPENLRCERLTGKAPTLKGRAAINGASWGEPDGKGLSLLVAWTNKKLESTTKALTIFKKKTLIITNKKHNMQDVNGLMQPPARAMWVPSLSWDWDPCPLWDLSFPWDFWDFALCETFLFCETSGETLPFDPFFVPVRPCFLRLFFVGGICFFVRLPVKSFYLRPCSNIYF